MADVEAIKYCESHQQVEQDEFEKATGIGQSAFTSFLLDSAQREGHRQAIQ